jgi:hypothetical protein
VHSVGLLTLGEDRRARRSILKKMEKRKKKKERNKNKRRSR